MKLSPLYYLALLLAAVFVGCAAVHPLATVTADGAIARIDARAQGIVANTDRLQPLTESAGLPVLAAVRAEAQNIRADAKEAAESNKQINEQYGTLKEDRDRIYHSPGYTAQRWFIGLLITGAVSWVVMGFVGAVMAGLGTGGIFAWGRRLLNILPFSGPWSKLSYKLEGKPGGEGE